MPPARRPPPARGRPPGRPARPRRPPGRPGAANRPERRSLLWRWRRGLFLGSLLLVAGLAGGGYVLANIELPEEQFQAQTSFICAADVAQGCSADNALARLFSEQDRVPVRLEDVPEVMVQAVLAAEDRDFFDHGGVDPVGIARAAWADIRGGALTQGGSTITQQYVKNYYLTSDRSVTRKVREAVLAIKLEQELAKEEILERYLNTIYFGRGAYGLGAAARTYFGHGVAELDLAEAAYLAGLIRAPEAADAVRAPEEATRRRRTVLDAMLEEAYIDRAQADAADAEPWVSEGEGATIRPRTDRAGLDMLRGEDIGAKYFAEYVRLQLLERGYSDTEIYGGGLRVYTTLDLSLQESAWRSVTSTLDRPDDPAAALVALDDAGYVKSMVGGRDFATSEVNLAVGTEGGGTGRQPGSAMKPFVLGAAVRQGISLDSRFNSPSRLVIPDVNAGADYTVNNYGGTEQGVLDLLDATRVSSNTAYAQLMAEVGPEDVVALAGQMGITAPLEANFALVLGVEEVSVLDMASAYSTLARRGTHIAPTAITRVERPDGRVDTFEQASAAALSEQQADLVTHALRQVVERGTGTAARLGVAAAGKTGTTQDNRDAWFVGYTPDGFTTAVWMGYDPVRNADGSETTRFMDDVHGREVTGGSFPAEIWHDFMADRVDGVDVGRFANPGSFPGEVLNAGLADATTTTSGVPESTTTSVPGASTSTTARPGGPASTTVPGSTTTMSVPATTSTTTGTAPPPSNPPPGPSPP